jgi:hypothetical protein
VRDPFVGARTSEVPAVGVRGQQQRERCGEQHDPGERDQPLAARREVRPQPAIEQHPEHEAGGDERAGDGADARRADVPLPAGVLLRRVSTEADVRAMCAMVGAVFEDPDTDEEADALLRRLTFDDGMELWVAESQGQIISAGRLEPVRGSQFAGIWGGATRADWRRRGVYRALTAARARSALRAGKALIHSDSTEYSRPILERSGLVRVSTTTPYRWRR